jgi:hypothetical protein
MRSNLEISYFLKLFYHTQVLVFTIKWTLIPFTSVVCTFIILVWSLIGN